MPAPTLARPATAASTAPNTSAAVQSNAGASVAPPMIPFTRAARKKSRTVGLLGPITLGAGQQQLNPVQVPANGFLRRLILDVTGTAAGNSATVAFANDAPFNVLQQVSFAAANGDSIINPLDGFSLYAVNKYGAFSSQTKDPLLDPTFSKTTGSGSTGGSFHFQLEIPIELDSRDGLGSLANMASNQAFLLQMFVNASAQLYTTAPTAPPAITIQITAEYWAAPAAANAQGIPQQTSPRAANVVSLLQTQTPAVVAGTDQTIPLVNVGNTVRWLMFIARTAGGVRTDADWPAVFNLLVNNDLWNYKTKNNWRRQMAQNYDLGGGIATAPTIQCLDTGVYVITEFMNDGAPGGEVVSNAANRDLMLVTGSGTALSIEAQNWGASIGSLQVITNALRVPDPTAFYAPFGI